MSFCNFISSQYSAALLKDVWMDLDTDIVIIVSLGGEEGRRRAAQEHRPEENSWQGGSWLKDRPPQD